MASFKIQEEVFVPQGTRGARLCFQFGTYRYDSGKTEPGYRFIWRRPNGNLQPARGQARIPSADVMFTLLRKANDAGWFSIPKSN